MKCKWCGEETGSDDAFCDPWHKITYREAMRKPSESESYSLQEWEFSHTPLKEVKDE